MSTAVEGAPLAMRVAASTARRTESSPMPNAVVGTLLYLAAALMVFAGFVSAHLVLRLGAPAWPPPGQPRLPLGVSLAGLALLGVSGAFAVRAWRASEASAARRAFAAAAVLGAIFLAIQGWEWIRLVRFGLLTSRGAFGGTFYALVGTHAVHAAGGLVALIVAARRTARWRSRATATALYWIFVATIWPILFVAVYL